MDGLTYPIISADSHIPEPPDMYIDHIDPRFRDRAPRLQHVEGVGDMFVIDGMQTPIPMGIVAAAGKPAEEIRLMGVRFEELHPGGWNPEARLADQSRDGVAAEIIYPDGRHGHLQPPRSRLQAGLLRGVQPLAGRVLRHASRAAARRRANGDAHAGGRHRGHPFDQGARAARCDDAGTSRRRGLRLTRV